MKAVRTWAVLACVAFAALRAGGADVPPANPAARVIILANSSDPASLDLARYYAQKRAIPAENILSFPMPETEAITWQEFVESVWQPVQDELVRRKWIDAVTSNLRDEVGRRRIAPKGHRISYLVVCRGVPLKIRHSNAFAAADASNLSDPNHTNQAAVDSELALLARTSSPVNGYVPNPLYGVDRTGLGESSAIVRVSRLDGPTYEQARQLVDHALEAERNGLMGRGYVDIGGIHPTGDRWLESVAAQIESLGFDLDVDRTPATLPMDARMDAPVFYFGWYSKDLTGPFLLPGFRFPPGAVALHIHSYSAETLRSATEGWTGPLIARGVTATVGNVFEPYLQLTHNPALLFGALARGDTWGEAGFFALPAVSWEAILIGDPLFRPFGPSSVDLQKSGGAVSPGLAGYGAIRLAHLLDALGRGEEALASLRRELAVRPGFAVAMELARRLEAAGDPKGAAAAISAVGVGDLAANEWALARAAARHLAADGAPEKAVEIYQRLFAIKEMPRELRIPWLKEASLTAAAAKDSALAARWEKESGE